MNPVLLLAATTLGLVTKGSLYWLVAPSLWFGAWRGHANHFHSFTILLHWRLYVTKDLIWLHMLTNNIGKELYSLGLSGLSQQDIAEFVGSKKHHLSK